LGSSELSSALDVGGFKNVPCFSVLDILAGVLGAGRARVLNLGLIPKKSPV
jgi:hypothetical protein